MSRNIKELHPKLQQKIAELKVLCEKKGMKLLITDCLRDKAEQADCVKRGTSSLYYPKSMHNWGVAFDFCKNVKGHEYDDITFFKKVGKLGQSIGLEWGGAWKSPVDRPHFQLPDWGTGVSKLKKTYGTPENFRKTWTVTNDEKLPLSMIVDKVICGEFGNYPERKEKLEKLGYDYDEIQRIVTAKLKNETLSNIDAYFPACDKKHKSLVDALISIRADASFHSRKLIAKENGISSYFGKASENMLLMELLKNGKLKRP